MANIVPDSFKTDTLKGTFNFKSTAQGGGSTFKLALYDDISAFSTATTAYTTTNEVSSSGTNYTAGGNTLTNFGVNISSNIAYVDFDDLTFSSVTLTAVGALIYKGTSNEAVLVLDFGGSKTATNGDFVVQFPTADSSNAIIRLGDA
jgi:beta-glucanase (GH16 family)